MNSGREHHPTGSGDRFARCILLFSEIAFTLAALVSITLAVRRVVDGQIALSILLFFGALVCAFSAYRSALGLRKMRQRVD
jgi:ABC-type multidrug transport system permease subunit